MHSAADVLRYDKTGDNHYDTISAFIKSMRGSDPDAAVYYLAKNAVCRRKRHLYRKKNDDLTQQRMSDLRIRMALAGRNRMQLLQ